jgi:cytoskeletal protein RodZ
MKKNLNLVLAIIGLSSVIVLGSILVAVQPIFASSEQETAGEDEPQDQSGGDESETSEPGDGSETSGQEPTDESEPEPAEDISALNDEQQQEQEQLALDILTANGLTPLNATNGNGGGGDGTIEKCAVSQQGQTFCYEPLEPDKNCLTPIKAEDPPLCPPK